MTRDLRGFDLVAAMRQLYETGEYFASVPPGETAYEENYWGEIVDPDGKRRNRLEERERCLADLRAELKFLESLPPGRMLDVGCGPGWLLSALDDSWKRFGVEVSAFAVEHAKAHGEIYVGPLLDCPFPEGSFDLVTMHHVIEHMADPTANIVKARRLLKPGGWLMLATPDFDSGCARRFGANYRLLHDTTHVSLFSNDSMHRFLRDHGFRIRRVDYPFFETRYFTPESLNRLFDTDTVSPPFYGNFMTFFCTAA